MNKRELQKILASSAIDPKNPGALGIILETGDVRYLMTRSREMIAEAEACAGIIPTEVTRRLQMAIALLAIAQYKLINGSKDAPQKRKKSKDNQLQHQGDAAQLQADQANREQQTKVDEAS